MSISCPCGSGNAPAKCCLPDESPVIQPPGGYDAIKVEFGLTDERGREVQVPLSWRAELTLKNPHQLDAVIEDLADHWLQAIEARFSLVKKPDIEDLTRAGDLLANLVHSWYSVRYHQRQALVRLRLVEAHASEARIRANARLALSLSDVPLRSEIEAFLIRLRGSLDPLAMLTGLFVANRPIKFGALFTGVTKNLRMNPAIKADLKRLFGNHAGWIDEVRGFRDNILHEAAFPELSEATFNSHGVLAPRIESKNARDLLFERWTEAVTISSAIASLLKEHANSWEFPQI